LPKGIFPFQLRGGAALRSQRNDEFARYNTVLELVFGSRVVEREGGARRSPLCSLKDRHGKLARIPRGGGLLGTTVAGGRTADEWVPAISVMKTHGPSTRGMRTSGPRMSVAVLTVLGACREVGPTTVKE
jgi:hypothetical protein